MGKWSGSSARGMEQQLPWGGDPGEPYNVGSEYHYAEQFYQSSAGYGQPGFPYFIGPEGIPVMMTYSVPVPGMYGGGMRTRSRHRNVGSGAGDGAGHGTGGGGGGGGGNSGSSGNSGGGGGGGGGSGRKEGSERASGKSNGKLNLQQCFLAGSDAVSVRILELGNAVLESRHKADSDWQGEEQRIDDKLSTGDALEQLCMFVFENASGPTDVLAARLIGLLGLCVFGSTTLRTVFISAGISLLRDEGANDGSRQAVGEILQLLKRIAQEAPNPQGRGAAAVPKWRRAQDRATARPGQSNLYVDVAEAFAEIQSAACQLQEMREECRELTNLLARDAPATESAIWTFRWTVLGLTQTELSALAAKSEKGIVSAWNSCLRPLEDMLHDLTRSLNGGVSTDDENWSDDEKALNDTIGAPTSRGSVAALVAAKECSGRLNETLQALLSLAEFSVQNGVVPSGTGGVFQAARELASAVELVENTVRQSVARSDRAAADRKSARSGRKLRFAGVSTSGGGSQRRHTRMKSSPDELLHLSDNLNDMDGDDEDNIVDNAGTSPVQRQLSEELHRAAIEEQIEEPPVEAKDADNASVSASTEKYRRDHVRSRSVEYIIQM